ncbi:hypothetical protein DRN79_02685 [Methanosarcinales archaeon]|nr:MAG: hypothetical protein DRN79_02685 [Methanosarcinales archaeon]
MDEMMWMEKHRPREIEEIVGQKHVKARVKAFLDMRTVPNLLLYGPQGTGKTSLAFVIARSLYGDFWHENMLYVECADFIEHRKAWLKQNEHFRIFYDEYKSAVEIFNQVIKEYAGIPPMDADFRIIFLKNADLLPANIQQSLRRMIEKYNRTCRFIFSAKMPARIIQPIRSRCLPLHFKPLDRQKERIESFCPFSSNSEMRGYGTERGEGDRGECERSALQQLLLRIFRREGFSVTEEALKTIEYCARCAGGGAADAGVAICIGEAASAVVSCDLIDKSAVESVAEHILSHREHIRRMLNAAFEGKAIAVQRGADISEIYEEMRELLRAGTERNFAKLFLLLSETDFDIRDAFNEIIHIEHMLMQFSRICRYKFKATDATAHFL